MKYPRATMQLYFSPKACSLVPHIVLRAAGVPFDLVKVDLGSKKLADGTSFTGVNPKGYVPALVLDNGELLTENQVMQRYIADLAPETNLAPKPGTFERIRLEEMLNFLATELHKGTSAFFSPDAGDAYKASVTKRLDLRLEFLANKLGESKFLLGDHFTVADAYAFWCLGIVQHVAKIDLAKFPPLAAYYARLGEVQAVKDAVAAEASA